MTFTSPPDIFARTMGAPPPPAPTGARRPAVLAAAAVMLGIFSHRALPHFAIVYIGITIIFALAALLFFHDGKLSTAFLSIALFTLGITLAQLESFYFPRTNIGSFAADEPRFAWLELH